LSKGGTTFCSGTCANNKLPSPWVYDARGNLTTNGNETLTYDWIGRQRRDQSSGGGDWTYIYDGGNERVAKVPSGGTAIYTLRDPGNRVVTEYFGSTLGRDNVYLGNLLVASNVWNAVAGAVGYNYYHSDHLGSPRLVTDGADNAVESPRKYWPYGDGVPGNPGTLQRIRFAAMERDSETTRYYDHARHHEAVLGRFLSPDKLGGKPKAPQSWNRYSYASNNPIKLVDPNGLCSAPAGVGNGNVGVCIEAFIASKWVPGSLFGRGDDRTFSGTDPSLTSRIQVQLLINTQTGNVSSSVSTGTSHFLLKSPLTGRKGTTVSSVGSVPTGDNSTSISVGAYSCNGFAGAPTAATSPIQFNVGLEVDANGKVTVDPNATQAKTYPSFAGYSYGPDGSVTTLFQQPENKIGDLDKPMQPLAPSCSNGTMVGPCPR
jgi:RHS repeat-associated protein